MNLRYAMRSEDTEQIQVINWAQWYAGKYEELNMLHHIPNGGSRNKAEAVKLKQMGVRAGVPDLCLPVPKGIYAGLYIELKYGDGRIEKSQREFLKEAVKYGHFCVVCYGAEEAIHILQEYVNLLPLDAGSGENRMKVKNASILKKGKEKDL